MVVRGEIHDCSLTDIGSSTDDIKVISVNRQCQSLHERNLKRISIIPGRSLNAQNDWNHNRKDVHGGQQCLNSKRGNPNVCCITKDKVSQCNKRNESLNNKDLEWDDARKKSSISHGNSLEIMTRKKYKSEVQRGCGLKSNCNFAEEKNNEVLKAKKSESLYNDQNKSDNMTKQQKMKQKTRDFLLQTVKCLSKEKMHKNFQNKNLKMKKTIDDCQHKIVDEGACPTVALENLTGTKQCFGQSCMLTQHKYVDLEKELEKSDLKKNVDCDGGKKCNLEEVKDFFLNKRKEKEWLQVKLDPSRFNDNAKKDMSYCTEQTNIKTFADPQNVGENEKSDDDELEESEALEVLGESDLTDDYETSTVESDYSKSGPASGQEDSWPYPESDESMHDNKILESTCARQWLDEVDEKIKPEIRKKCISCSEDLDEKKYQRDEKEKEESQNIIEKKVQNLEINNNLKNSNNIEEKYEKEKDDVYNKFGKDARNIGNIQSTEKKSDECDNNSMIEITEDAVRTEIFIDAVEKDEIDLKENIVSMFSESNDRKVESEICGNKDQNKANAANRSKGEESLRLSRNVETTLKSNWHNKKYNGANQLPMGFHIYLNKLGKKVTEIQLKVSDMELKMTELGSKISEMEDQFRDGDMLAESLQIHNVHDVWQNCRRHCASFANLCKQPKLYARRVLHPVVPDYLGSNIWLPEDRHDKRWYEIFTVGKGFGRQCSSSGNGNGGHMNGNGKSNTNYNKNNAEKDGSKENNNNGWSDKYNSNNKGNYGNANGSSIEPTKNTIGTVAVKYDPKRYRKKHCDMDMHESEEWIGHLMHNIKRNEGPVLQVPGHDVVMKTCVMTCLTNPEELSDDMLNCFLCTSINSLLQHYANCVADFNGCNLCLQIFSIICAHVHDCVNNNMLYTCEIQLCIKIKLALVPNDITKQMRTLWFNVRKKLARIIDRVDRAEWEDKDYAKMLTQSSVSMQPTLPSIPENGPVTDTSSRSGSRVIICYRSNLSDVPETVVSGPEVQLHPEVEMHECDAVLMSKIPSGQGSDVVCAFTGVQKFHSLPLGPPGHGEHSPNFKDKPTGVKGIEEKIVNNKYYSIFDSKNIKTNEIEGDLCKDLKKIVLAPTVCEPDVEQVPPNAGVKIVNGVDKASVQHHSFKPSQAEQNIDPRVHIYNFINDNMLISNPNVPLNVYQPYPLTVQEEPENQLGINDEDIMQELLPNFKALEISLSITEKDIHENDSDEKSTKEEHNQFRDYEFDNAREEIVRNFIPTVPVISPSKSATTQVNPAYQRAQSEIPHVQSTPNMTAHSPSSKDSKMSRSTARSQFEEQDEAFVELSRIPRDDLSHHSGSDSLMLDDRDMEDVTDDPDLIHGEIDLDIEDPASSLAHYLDHSIDEPSMYVTFRSGNNGEEWKIRFAQNHFSRTWYTIIDEELVQINFGFTRYIITTEDGTAIDLDQTLGAENLIVIVQSASDNDPWWVQAGMIMRS